MEPTTGTTISVTWWDIARFALTTGLVTALFNQGIGWFRDWRKESTVTIRDATYAAMRIAVLLEAFAMECASLIEENAFAEKSGGPSTQKLPSLSEYPTDIDWKSLDSSLAAQSLSIRNELRLSVRTIAFWSGEEPAEIPSVCSNQAGKCGYRAWQLATALRRHYKLPSFDPTQGYWDLVGTLQKRHDAVIKAVTPTDMA